ncbi:hypothetical protein [Bosea sp. (in: a-proteobacteria)]
MKLVLLALFGMGLATSALADEALCRSADRVANPCYSDAIQAGWLPQPGLTSGSEGYFRVKRGGTTLNCVRFKDRQTDRLVEEGCEPTQANLSEELQYRIQNRK